MDESVQMLLSTSAALKTGDLRETLSSLDMSLSILITCFKGKAKHMANVYSLHLNLMSVIILRIYHIYRSS